MDGVDVTDGGTSGVDPVATATSQVKGSVQFLIPPLKPNDRIDEWEPLFRVTVTDLLTHENGGQPLKLGWGPGSRDPQKWDPRKVGPTARKPGPIDVKAGPITKSGTQLLKAGPITKSGTHY